MDKQTHKLFYERLTPDNAALLLIDHQAGLFLGVKTLDPVELKNNVVGLARVAKAMELPVVLTTSFKDGPNGPLLPEIHEVFPKAHVIDRTLVNAWDDPEFVKAVEKTGRKKLIMAGVTTDVCLTFPAIAATAAGYHVYGVIDASGTWSQTIELVAAMRMTQAGVIMTNWSAVGADLLRDHASSAGKALDRVMGESVGLFSFLSAIVSGPSRGGS